jgi:hypothetical protein
MRVRLSRFADHEFSGSKFVSHGEQLPAGGDAAVASDAKQAPMIAEAAAALEMAISKLTAR